MKTRKIVSIETVLIPDYDSPKDYLGEFSDEPGKFAVPHNGDRGAYKYFNATNVENMKQAKQNYKEMMRYETGELIDYGVKAVATIHTSIDGGNTWLINTFESGGLWGMSGDTDKDEFISEEDNQVEELRRHLNQLHFGDIEFNSIKVTRKV